MLIATKHLRDLAILTGVFVGDRILKSQALVEGKFIKNYHALWGLEISWWVGLAALILALVLLSKKSHLTFHAFPLGLILTGILSNALDKNRLGFIIDYIYFADWFCFNLSDLSIILGMALILRKLWK